MFLPSDEHGPNLLRTVNYRLMAVEILMPELGESVHEGTVSRWLKKVGDYVKEDEPVVEIMTDKVNTELGAPASGVLTQILIPEGSPVEVFKAMGIIEDGQGATPSAKPPVETPAEAPAQMAAVQPEAVPATPNKGDRRWFSPVVRAMAASHGLSDDVLSGITGTGDRGRVTKKDLEAFLAKGAPQAQPAAVGPDQEVVPLLGMRKMIADAMVRSAAIPTVTTMTQVDVTAMVQYRERNKETFLAQHGVKLTYTPFFIKALAEALVEYPLVNASLQGDQIIKNRGVHIGVAVALGSKGDEGLIVPVIRDCHLKSLLEIARDLDGIAGKAREGKLGVADVQGGTFTLTNPGTYGALFGTPMINAPQAAIAGAYAIKKQPVVVDDMIALRSIMHLVLTYDHRLIDGLLAGKFLASVVDRLQKFEFVP